MTGEIRGGILEGIEKGLSLGFKWLVILGVGVLVLFVLLHLVMFAAKGAGQAISDLHRTVEDVQLGR